MSPSAFMTLSVVLPCYNEEANVQAAVIDVVQWMEREGINGKIIAVNDGSSDDTGAILDRLAQQYPALQPLHLAKNQGYGLAIRAGCDIADTEWIAFMDSDGQFKAQDLSVLLAHAPTYAFVTGRRIKRADPFIRNMFGIVLAVMNGVMLGIWIRDVNCGLKLFRRTIWQDIRPTHGVEKLFNTEMFLRLAQKGIEWHQVDVPHYPRTAGTPTGGSVRVIVRMFKELMDLRRSVRNAHETMPSLAGVRPSE